MWQCLNKLVDTVMRLRSWETTNKKWLVYKNNFPTRPTLLLHPIIESLKTHKNVAIAISIRAISDMEMLAPFVSQRECGL